MKNKSISFFAGSNTSLGFVSFFKELYSLDGEWKCFILKGGAGTGKSSLMKNIAKKLQNNGIEVHYVYCSSDPDSLDAIVCPKIKATILDGTAPHSVEPEYPGAVENIINLGEYWNEKELRASSKEIIRITNSTAQLHKRCINYLSAASLVKKEIYGFIKDGVKKQKIQSYCDRFSNRIFKKKPDKTGIEKKVFFSTVTPKGIVSFTETIENKARTIMGVEDKYGLCSGHLMKNMRDNAIKNGYNVMCGYSPIEPFDYPEQVIIPELAIAFVRVNEHNNSIANRVIHCERFYEKEEIDNNKNKLVFHLKIQNELLGEAIKTLKKAKEYHDKLEKIYVPTMNFSGYELLAESVIQRMIE